MYNVSGELIHEYENRDNNIILDKYWDEDKGEFVHLN
jgi:hypothetical protein